MNRLRELRKKRGLTLIELAKEININKSSIARFETEISTMDAKDLDLFSKYFGVTVDYILGNTNNPNAIKVSVADSDGSVNNIEYELINKMDGFTADDFQKVSDYIDFLKMQKEKGNNKNEK